MAITQKIYAIHYINAKQTANTQLGPVGSSFMTDMALLDFAEALANKIKTTSATSSFPLFVSNDPLPTE